MEGRVIVNESISYKIYPKSTPSNDIYKELKANGIHSIYPVHTRDHRVINGWLKYVKPIDIDFNTHFILFMLDYGGLPSTSPRIYEDTD